jgi:hypothetical protein
MFVWSMLAIALFALQSASAQETTAGLQGTVKDPSGAVVSGATVEASSPALIGKKTAITDSGGYYRFANLPPGAYSVTVTAPNFRSYKQEGITLAVGHLPTMDVTLQVGTASETVEVTGSAPIVDVTQSKVQTNVTSDVLQNVPTGRSFQSVIQFAPGARSEPLQGGFQIDGASNSENSYLVEGQETADVRTGASNTNVPMEFIQEVQIKSSGFEAEYGGALGGVVNVVQKRGSNEWHGSVFTYYEGDKFEAAPNRVLRRNPDVAAVAATRLDQPAQYIQPKKDKYSTVEPGLELGGYLLKDRLWSFASFVPRINNIQRTVDMKANGVRTFNESDTTYFSMARLDFLATQKIRLFGAWQYNYQRQHGGVFPNPDDVFGTTNTTATTAPDSFNGSQGFVAPSVIYNTGADITLTPNLVATTRFGYFYTDFQNRGLPQGLQYAYRNTNYAYSTGNAPAPATLAALNGQTLGTQSGGKFVNSTGWTNIGANFTVFYNQFARKSFSQDLAYFKKALGTHNVKFGYAMNKLANNVNTSYNTGDVYVGYNIRYSPYTTTGVANCMSIENQNFGSYGTYGGSTSKTTGLPTGANCQGLWGTVNLRDFSTIGKVSSNNHALYVQDAWTPGAGLTINAGVRLDKESLPSFTKGFPGIAFGFGDKVAPRLGASWDVLRNGKFKVYGSFGYFFDIMKYELPRGSFGGDYWHDCVYALDTPDFTAIVPQRDANSRYCPTSGGANLASAVPGLRFIENFDFRHPSNDPTQAGSLGSTGLIDPNLKPMKQHEYVFGADWAISPTLAFESRYSRKRLDRTIEDSGIITNEGEVYYITNPGEGVNSKVAANICPNCPANIKPVRNYDGVEFRLTRRSTGRWFGQLSYTYSRLYGNYSGLTATDLSDGGGARNAPNVDRAFDEPFMQFDAHGNRSDGPLATDRPHTFKALGYYRVKWWKFETLLGGYQQVYSGSPVSSYISVWGAPVFVEGRGKWVDFARDANGDWVPGQVSSRRTPMFSQTDFNFVQQMHVSKTNEKLIVAFEGNITNIFNQHSPTLLNSNLLRSSFIGPASCGTTGTSCTADATNIVGFDYAALMSGGGYDYASQANSDGVILSSMYNKYFGWQGGRTMRFKVRFSF